MKKEENNNISDDSSDSSSDESMRMMDYDSDSNDSTVFPITLPNAIGNACVQDIDAFCSSSDDSDKKN